MEQYLLAKSGGQYILKIKIMVPDLESNAAYTSR